MKKANRVLAAVLSCAMAVSVMLSVAVTASAASTNNKKASAARVWDGTADTSWYTGKKDSYNIYTAEEFAGISVLCNRNQDRVSFNGITINIMNDIALNDTSNVKNWATQAPANRWEPVGSKGSLIGQRGFEGCINGNGHTISGLYVRSDGWNWLTDGGGLFRYTYCSAFVNLRIEDGYVFAPSPSAALIGSAEATYIENIEVENVTVDSQKAAGAIVGETANIDLGRYAATIGQLPFMAFGYFINPLILDAASTGSSPADTYLLNCKAKDCSIKGEQAGGLVGGITECTGIYNCLSESNYINCTAWRNREWGGIYGLVNIYAYDNPGVLYEVKKSYVYDASTPSGYPTTMADEKDVNIIKKKATLTKSSFAKKLGDGFEYVKGSSPRVKAILDTPVDIILNGKNASIDWEPVKDAVKYKVLYKKSNGKYSALATTTKTQTKLKNISKGKSYEILIRAYFEDGTYKTVDGGKFKLKA